jgi:hypothetical protein
VLARLSDARVAQYWDKSHLFAEQLGQKINADMAQPKPSCCNRNGTQWDEVAVYRRDAKWNDELPHAVFLNGPVIRSLDFSKAVADLLSK